MPRRKTQDDDRNDDEFEFLQSQPNQNSDDQLLERVIAERLAAAQEKKKQERDKRFLDGAATKLDDLLSHPTDALSTATQSIEELYAKFLLDYAAAEDRIQNLWREILERHSALDMFIRDKHKDALEIASSTEGKHTSGLSKMKGVSEQYKAAIRALVPELDDI